MAEVRTSTVRNLSQASYVDVMGSLGPPSEIPDACRLAVGLQTQALTTTLSIPACWDSFHP